MTKTTYSFRDFTMVQPLRQALDYLQDHDECRAGLDALKYLVDTVGLDLGAVMERWEKVPHVIMPTHVAQQQQMSHFGLASDTSASPSIGWGVVQW
jgi:hypothetical protein